jgi:hypothetical protein
VLIGITIDVFIDAHSCNGAIKSEAVKLFEEVKKTRELFQEMLYVLQLEPEFEIFAPLKRRFDDRN